MSRTPPIKSCATCGSREPGILGCLPYKVLTELGINKISRSYQPGQVVFYEDHRPYGVYCLESGLVKLSKQNPDGKTYIVRIAKAGDLLGYRAFLTHESYAATAEVLETASICFIEREPFMKALAAAPEFILRLMEQLGTDLRTAESRALDLAYASVSERLAEMLLTLKDAYGEAVADGAIHLKIKLSREEMANFLGTTVETTVRTLTRFRENGLIDFDKKEIIIKDLKGLADHIPS